MQSFSLQLLPDRSFPLPSDPHLLGRKPHAVPWDIFPSKGLQCNRGFDWGKKKHVLNCSDTDLSAGGDSLFVFPEVVALLLEL